MQGLPLIGIMAVDVFPNNETNDAGVGPAARMIAVV